MTNVFISYRRSDSTSGYASWIYDRLAQQYGAPHVFMDMDSLSLGVDFVEQLQEALSKTDVALVLIGPGWLDARDESGRRRLEDESDFVRIEVGAALRASTRVIPVLIEGATVPHSTQLPEDLRPLSRRQALTFERQGGAAINNLLHAIEELGQGESDEPPVAVSRAPAPPEPREPAPAPSPRDRKRSRAPLAVVTVALVALAGVAAGVLVAAGAFSSSSGPSITTIKQARATQPPGASSSSQVTTPQRSTQPAANQQSPAGGVPAGTTSCGGGVSVGPHTSCPFAQNVERAYDRTTGGDQLVTAFSPVTGVTYTIECSGATPHVCTGGTTHDSSVYFSSGPGSGSSQAAAGGIPASATPCGGGVYVGANTSCGFAVNVQQAYSRTGGGDTNVTAVSPATGRTYVIHCTGLSPHVCTGGTTTNASVYFP